MKEKKLDIYFNKEIINSKKEKTPKRTNPYIKKYEGFVTPDKHECLADYND